MLVWSLFDVDKENEFSWDNDNVPIYLSLSVIISVIVIILVKSQIAGTWEFYKCFPASIDFEKKISAN